MENLTDSYKDIIETLALDHKENYRENEATFDFYWLLLLLVGLSGFCFILSVILNLSNISTIAGHFCLRPCGYFHILALFSAFNIVYFIFETIRQICKFLNETGEGELLGKISHKKSLMTIFGHKHKIKNFIKHCKFLINQFYIFH